MRNYWLVLFFIWLAYFSNYALAETITVSSLRYWTQPTKARIVLDLSAAASPNVSLTQNATRLVINLKQAHLASGLKQPAPNNVLFAGFHTALNSDNNFIFIIDLKRDVKYRSFTLTPEGSNGHRFVIDIFSTTLKSVASDSTPSINLPKKISTTKIEPPNQDNITVAKVTEPLTPTIERKSPSKSIVSSNIINTSIGSSSKKRGKSIIVAIDAGHGGKDPGSHGARGTEEKHVVFAIAKRLERLIQQQPGMKAVMIRNGDKFIKLRQRMQIARAAKADLFVSIHADAFTDTTVKGSSVFMLSERGASSEAARWLAKNENDADLVGGVSIVDKDEMLASVLLDLSQTATTEASNSIANKVLASFKGVNYLHKAAVQRAGFVVLKSPDIPSILVETAFISNPEEELKLRSDTHQTKIAKAIFNGIASYFKQYVPISVPTHMAEADHMDNG